MTEPVFRRYVAIGDSFMEGVGDVDPARPNEVRGWADRVAEVFAARDPDFRYANLAIRGRQLRQILDEQLAPAVAMEPDLVTIYAGANDILRATVDLDGLVATYDDAIGQLAATGAVVLMWTRVRPRQGAAAAGDAWPLRDVQRAGARGGRPPRGHGGRLLADA